MSVLWLVLVAAVMAVAQALLFGISGLRKVSYKRYFDRRTLYEGEDFFMIEEITSNKLLPMPWVKVESRIPTAFRFPKQDVADLYSDDAHHRSVFSLSSYTRIRRRHRITCMKRGYYNLSSVTLSAGDLLGIHSTSVTQSLKAELIVYPKLLDPRSLTLPSHRWQGDVIVHRWILPDPFLINGIREYRPGDQLRDIHWAATARTGILQTKTHDYTADLKLLLCLNTQIREDQWDNLNEKQAEIIEEGLSAAATLATWAIERGVEVGFSSNGSLAGEEDTTPVYVEARSSREQLALLMEVMARLRIRRRISMHIFMEEELIGRAVSGLDIILLTNYWSDLLEEKAARLRAMGNAVTYLPVRREQP
ncbi:MAG: DUF58 domain-containing protein [Christensenellales bacterium]|jgi:uncharacterized protein (DUF58 family)